MPRYVDDSHMVVINEMLQSVDAWYAQSGDTTIFLENWDNLDRYGQGNEDREYREMIAESISRDFLSFSFFFPHDPIINHLRDVHGERAVENFSNMTDKVVTFGTCTESFIPGMPISALNGYRFASTRSVAGQPTAIDDIPIVEQSEVMEFGGGDKPIITAQCFAIDGILLDERWGQRLLR